LREVLRITGDRVGMRNSPALWQRNGAEISADDRE